MAPSSKQHEGSLMKAILFAVASIFVVTASATPSLARPLTKARPNRAQRPATSPALRDRHTAPLAITIYTHTARARHRNISRRARARASVCSRGHSTRSTSASGARPARWCGWWMRTQKGGGPELNLACNWKNWGRPSGPRVGAVVVWSHHVGMITGRTASGQWIVKSGNDGGRVRERPRSVAGAVFRV